MAHQLHLPRLAIPCTAPSPEVVWLLMFDAQFSFHVSPIHLWGEPRLARDGRTHAGNVPPRSNSSRSWGVVPPQIPCGSRVSRA